MLFSSLIVISQNNRKNYQYNKYKVQGIAHSNGMKYPKAGGRVKIKRVTIYDTIYTYDTIYIIKERYIDIHEPEILYDFKSFNDTILISDDIDIDDIEIDIPDNYINTSIDVKPSPERIIVQKKKKKRDHNFCFYVGLNGGYPLSVGADIWIPIKKVNIGAGVSFPVHDRSSYSVRSFYGSDIIYNVFLAYDVGNFKLGAGLQIMPINYYTEESSGYVNKGHDFNSYGGNIFIQYQLGKVVGVYGKASYYPELCNNKIQGQIGISFKICM